MPSAEPVPVPPLADANKIALAQKLVAISEQMSAHIEDNLDEAERNGEFAVSRLTALDAERQTVIQQLFAEPVPDHLSAEIGPWIQRAIAANNALLARCRQRQQWLDNELRGFSASRRANAAYTSVDRAG